MDHAVQLYGVEIFTAAARFLGELTVPGDLRISDVVNHHGHRMISLNQVTIAKSTGELLTGGTRLERVAVDKQNIIALLVRSGPSGVLPNSPHRIQRIPEYVVVYAPPYVFVGAVHRAPQAGPLGPFESAGAEFISVTAVTAWWMESSKLLGAGIEFMALNRRWVVAVHPYEQGVSLPAGVATDHAPRATASQATLLADT